MNIPGNMIRRRIRSICLMRFWRLVLCRTILSAAIIGLILEFGAVLTKVELYKNAYDIYLHRTTEKSLTMMEKFQIRQSQRLKILQSYCESLNITGQLDGTHRKCAQTLVDHDRKFIYCVINKCSSSSMKKALVNGTGLTNFTNEKQMKINNWGFMHKHGVLHRCVPKEKIANITDYFKFIIVRHPLKRLLSAYRDKFLGKHKDNIRSFQKGIGTKIIRKYRMNATELSLKKGHDVTFEEFLQYVLNGRGRPNNHWNSYWSSCYPCHNSFDFIASMETMDEDISYILQRVSNRPVPMPQNGNRLVAPKKTDNTFKDYYGQVQEWIIEGIIKKFNKDFRMFGYDPYIYK